MAEQWIPPDQPDANWTPPDTPDEDLTTEKVAPAASQHLAEYRAGTGQHLLPQDASTLDAFNYLRQQETEAMQGKSSTQRQLEAAQALPGQIGKAASGVKDWFSNLGKKIMGLHDTIEHPAESAPNPDVEYFKAQGYPSEKAIELAANRTPPEQVGQFAKELGTGPAFAKMVGALSDMGAHAINQNLLGPGVTQVAEAIPQVRPWIQQLQATNNAAADYLNGRIAETTKQLAPKIGLDPESTGAMIADFVPWFVNIPGMEMNSAEGIAKAVNAAARSLELAKVKAASGVMAASPTIGKLAKAAGGVAGAEALRSMGLSIPHGMMDIGGAVAGMMLPEKIFKSQAIGDRVAAAMLNVPIEDVPWYMRAAKEATPSVSIHDAMANAMESAASKKTAAAQDALSDLGKLENGKPQLVERKAADGTWLHDTDKLPAAQRAIRTGFDEAEALQKRAALVRRQGDAEKVLSDIKTLLANSAAHVLHGASIGAGFQEVTSPTGAPEGGEGALLGAFLSAPLSPFAGYAGMQANRLGAAARALIARGGKILDPAQLEGLTQGQKEYAMKMAAMNHAAGAKHTDVLSPDEMRTRFGITPDQPAPFGHYDPDTGVVTLNRSTLGAAGHEVVHPMQQLLGQLLTSRDPDFLKGFQDKYRAANGGRGFDTQSEWEAEVGRHVMEQSPPEAFYGGKKGFDILKQALRKWTQGNEVSIDPILNAPRTPQDVEAMREHFFKVGERAATMPEVPTGTPPIPDLGPEPPAPAPTGPAPATEPEPPPISPAHEIAVEALKATGIKAKDAEARVAATAQDLQDAGQPVDLDGLMRGAFKRSAPAIEEVGQPAQAPPPAQHIPDVTATDAELRAYMSDVFNRGHTSEEARNSAFNPQDVSEVPGVAKEGQPGYYMPAPDVEKFQKLDEEQLRKSGFSPAILTADGDIVSGGGLHSQLYDRIDPSYAADATEGWLDPEGRFMPKKGWEIPKDYAPSQFMPGVREPAIQLKNGMIITGKDAEAEAAKYGLDTAGAVKGYTGDKGRFIPGDLVSRRDEGGRFKTPEYDQEELFNRTGQYMPAPDPNTAGVDPLAGVTREREPQVLGNVNLPVENFGPHEEYVGEGHGLEPARFVLDAPGSDVTVPVDSYAAGQRKPDNSNVWVRQSGEADNTNRILMVQFTPDLQYPNGPDPVSTPYYDKLYSGTRPGYTRSPDFWEIPQWQAVVSHNLGSRADGYYVSNMDEAKAFMRKARYGHTAFSVMDVSEHLTRDLAPHIPGELHLGGYTDRSAIAAEHPNAKIYNNMNEFIEGMGYPYHKGFDYRLFRGTETIPRLEMSAGCRHRCTFCTIDRQLTESPMGEINQQVDSFKDMDAKLVYLNDKTFGQAKNYSELPRLYNEMKSANPEFAGFVIQTTAAQMKVMPDEFLKNSGIKYIEIGVETYNNDILKSLRKPATEKLIDESVEKMKRNGINFVPNIVIGFPGETAETYARTMDFLRKNEDEISHVNSYNLAVYQGTEISKSVKALTAADADENSPTKSFYGNSKIHENFARELYDFASKRLDKPQQFMPPAQMWDAMPEGNKRDLENIRGLTAGAADKRFRELSPEDQKKIADWFPQGQQMPARVDNIDDLQHRDVVSVGGITKTIDHVMGNKMFFTDGSSKRLTPDAKVFKWEGKGRAPEQFMPGFEGGSGEEWKNEGIPEIPTAHPDASAFDNNLFAVDVSQHPDMVADIGEKVYIKHPEGAHPKWGIKLPTGEFVTRADNGRGQPGAEPQEYTVAHLQKMWGHDPEGRYVPDITGYRLLSREGDFGRPALPQDVIRVNRGQFMPGAEEGVPDASDKWEPVNPVNKLRYTDRRPIFREGQTDKDVHQPPEDYSFDRRSAPMDNRGQYMPGFYSKLEKELEAKLPARATADQIRGTIRGAGIKKAEIEWNTPLADLLDQPGPHSKQDVLKSARAGTPIVETKILEEKKGQFSEDALYESLKEHAGMYNNEARDAARKIVNELGTEGWTEDQLSESLVYYADVPDGIANEVAHAMAADKAVSQTQYGEHTLRTPGGSNYREVLFHLGKDEPKEVMPKPLVVTRQGKDQYGLDPSKRWWILDGDDNKLAFIREGDDGGYYVSDPQMPDKKFSSLDDATKFAVLQHKQLTGEPFLKGTSQPVYTSPHFSHEAGNLLGHLRVDDQVLPDGRNMTFIQEAQADWAQDIREKGIRRRIPIEFKQREDQPDTWDSTNAYPGTYRIVKYGEGDFKALGQDASRRPFPPTHTVLVSHPTLEDAIASVPQEGMPNQITELPEGFEVRKEDRTAGLPADFWQVYDANGVTMGTPGTGTTKEAATRGAINEINRKTHLEQGQGVADMPFKGEAWKRLLLRQAIKEAVDAGHDSIGWTTGDMQNQRYNLRNHVKTISYNAQPDGFWRIQALTHDGNLIQVGAHLSDEQLPSVIGKELAQKILGSRKSAGDFEGLDLEIGGQGMKGFYDKELVNIANDIGKKYGTKVRDAEIDTRKDPNPTLTMKAIIRAGKTKGFGFIRPNGQWLSRVDPDGTYRFADISSHAKTFPDMDAAEEFQKQNINPKTMEKIHELPITDSLRKEVTERGQPMFMPGAERFRATPEERRSSIREGALPWEIRFNQLLKKEDKEPLTPQETQESDTAYARAEKEYGSFDNWYKERIGRTQFMPPTLNIGLDIADRQGALKPKDVMKVLNGVGALAQDFAVHKSPTGESTLVTTLKEPLDEVTATKVARQLDQEAIAQWDGRKGEVYGPNAQAWRPFNPAYFIDHDGRPMSGIPSVGEDRPTREAAMQQLVMQEHAERPPSPRLASGQWDSLFVEGTGEQKRLEIAPEIGVPEDKHFFEQKPEARQAITDYFKDTGEAQYMPGQKTWDQIASHLDEEELASFRDNYKQKIIDAFKKLSLQKGIEFAKRGAKGKNWYTDSVNAINDLLASDIPELRSDPDRFAGLLAALSPNRAVSSDLTHSLQAWAEWERQGRPHDRNTIEDIIARTNVKSGQRETKNMPAYLNNAFRVLTAADPAKVRLSGQKVDPFFANLRGDMNKVTNDRHMGFYAYGTPTIGRRTAQRPGEPKGTLRDIPEARGLALTAHVRQIAEHLTRISGEKWTPAEVQAAIWTYQLPLKDVADSMGVTVKQLLSSGYELPEKQLDKVPSFANLIHHEINQRAVRSIRSRRRNPIPEIRTGAENRPQGGAPQREVSGAIPDLSEHPF